MKNILQLMGLFFLCVFLLTCQKEFSYSDLSNNSSTYDVDAHKFIDISGITDTTQKVAIINFVKQLKDSSLWTNFLAIYPMLGGTATSTKWNLKDPRNSDNAYRLTFYGTPVYANTGVLFLTTSDYADTHLTDQVFNNNDNAISYYSRTQNNVNGYDMGCSDTIAPYNEMAIYNGSDASNWFGYRDFGPKPANTKGLFMFSATTFNITRYENGAVKNSSSGAPVSSSTGYPILIGTVSAAPTVGKRECSLATIGTGLTDAQALTFYNIVQNFETALGR